MQASRAERVAGRVAEMYGRSIADHIGVELAPDSPTALFQLLCVSVLDRPRVLSWTSMAAARAFDAEGWSTPERLAASPWRDRLQALQRAGYERSPERISFVVGHLAEGVRDHYEGDLSKLREDAKRDPTTEKGLLKELRGVEDESTDVFFREVQGVWDELCPFADERVLRAAHRIGLPDDTEALAELVEPDEFTRLTAGLAHVDRSDAYEAVVEDGSLAIDLGDRGSQVNAGVEELH